MGNLARRTNKETVTRIECAKEKKTSRRPLEWKDENKTVDKSDNRTGRNKSENIGERRGTQKIAGQTQALQRKQDIPK